MEANGRLVIAVTAVIVGALGAFVIYRLRNRSVTIFTRVPVENITLTDGGRVELQIDIQLSVQNPTADQTHANISRNAERIAKQSSQQALSPYNSEDITDKASSIKEGLKSKLIENMKRAGYNASSIFIEMNVV